MKRVGIISMYYKNYNYGGMLQSFALCEAISKYTNCVEQISYDRFKQRQSTKQKAWKILKEKGIRVFIRRGIRATRRFFNRYVNVKLEQRNKLFEEFMQSIPHSKYVSEERLSDLNELYDIFICGSDQIWNPVWWNDAFFLSFVNDGKIKASYAASIGVSKMSEEQKQYMCSKIKDFNYISIRESNLKKELEHVLERGIECVLDPTMLLSKEEYEHMCVKSIVNTPYVFVYLLGNSRANKNTVKKVADKAGLKIVYIPFVAECGFGDDLFGDYALYNVGPIQFLTLIRDAELVLTDSFHGSAFSILFEKNFYTLYREKKNKKDSMMSRLETLLCQFNLEDRLVCNYGEIEAASLIDYKQVNMKLLAERKRSLSYIAKVLQQNEK